MSRLADDQMIPAIEWFAEQMPGGFFVYRADDSQEILYVNEATWNIFGCETLEEFKELTGNTFKGMVHPEDFASIQSSIDAQIADKANNNTDYVVYRIRQKDGSIRWVDDYGHYADLPGFGNVYYVFISDITERRIAQEEKEKNAMLALALREAERANVAKTAFLSNMSHEIRTPMNAIIGLDNIALKNTELSSETRDQLKKIGASARHLLSLINDILDMSRIESGRMTIRNEEFSFSEMLEQINTMIEAQCDDAKLEYICRVKGHVDDYYIGDDMKLKQVIINILGNAVKFTPAPGSVTFTVEELERNKDKAVLRFSMKDTGVGMDKEYIPKIFEAFSQENEGKANKYGSTGLGMAITKNIVDMMDGTIVVESEKNVGSEFIVTVSLGISAKGSAEAEIDAGSMKVLIIDDDITACEHAQMVLKKKGMTADYCLDGEEALDIFGKKKEEGEPYNLVLVDWKMPKWDGIETIKHFKERFKDDKAVIILTTYNWDEIMQEALDAGADGFLPKPFFAKSVLEQFKTVMTEGRKEREKEPEHKASLKGRHILLAEDVMINAEIMKQLLRMKEMECDHAENGKQAVELFEKSDENAYDAILMDIKMPEMNGLEATKAIRAMARPDAAKVPIIALTANAFDEDVQQSLDAGMVAHVTKPIEPDALYSTLERLIVG
ncbi:MAG: response regulator [Lachnospiraceae bacterium]|nr:response regulator [Lachnospiraceae bacterium]